MQSRRTISTGKKSQVMSEERRKSESRYGGKQGSSIRFEDEVYKQRILRDEPDFDQNIGPKNSRTTKSSSIFSAERKNPGIHISEKPYFYKDWTNIQTQTDSYNYKCSLKNHQTLGEDGLQFEDF